MDFIADGTFLGVGSGTTVHHLIAMLPQVRGRITGVSASSEDTARRLEAAGFRCANDAGMPDMYIDGADEADDNLQLIKGGGGAHTREKVIAHAAARFVCIVDESKRVDILGRGAAVPVEVLPMARSYAARKLAAMGADVRWREGFVSDNGGWILDAKMPTIANAAALERDINHIAGVVENGIFAIRRADVLLTASGGGVREESRR